VAEAERQPIHTRPPPPASAQRKLYYHHDEPQTSVCGAKTPRFSMTLQRRKQAASGAGGPGRRGSPGQVCRRGLTLDPASGNDFPGYSSELPGHGSEFRRPDSQGQGKQDIQFPSLFPNSRFDSSHSPGPLSHQCAVLFGHWHAESDNCNHWMGSYPAGQLPPGPYLVRKSQFKPIHLRPISGVPPTRAGEHIHSQFRVPG